MKIFNTILLIIFLFCLSQSAHCQTDGNAAIQTSEYKKDVQVIPGNEPIPGARICSCEIFTLFDQKNNLGAMALFVEKTGDRNDDNSKLLKGLLYRETIYIKNVFSVKYKTIERLNTYTSCDNVWADLKIKYPGIRIYNVLNADILGQLVKK